MTGQVRPIFTWSEDRSQPGFTCWSVRARKPCLVYQELLSHQDGEDIVGVGLFMDEIWNVKPKNFKEQQALAGPERNVSVLYVCHARLARPNHRAVKSMRDKDAFRDIDIGQSSALNNFPLHEGSNEEHAYAVRDLCGRQTWTGDTHRCRNYGCAFERWIKVPRYFHTGIMWLFESFPHEVEGQTSWAAEESAIWVEQDIGCMEKKIVSGGRREYINSSEDLHAYDTEIHPTVRYTTLDSVLRNGWAAEPHHKDCHPDITDSSWCTRKILRRGPLRALRGMKSGGSSRLHEGVWRAVTGREDNSRTFEDLWLQSWAGVVDKTQNRVGCEGKVWCSTVISIHWKISNNAWPYCRGHSSLPC